MRTAELSPALVPAAVLVECLTAEPCHHQPVSSPLIEEGVAALRAGDAATARRVFGLAVADVESGAALEGLAEALYLEREYSAAAAHYERAYRAYRRERGSMAAGRAARTVAWISGNVLGDWAVQSGWFARARTILSEAGEDRPERGWVLLIDAFSEPDAQVREGLLREAIAIGRRFGDPDIEFEALAYLGGLLIMTDRVEEGLVLCDEGLAAACAGELTDIATLDAIFCGFFWACELVNDVPRADQWMRAAAELMQRRNVVAAFCRAHYGGILTAAGRWDEAEAQLVESTRHFDRGMSERRAVGLIRLADLRLRQGRLEEAAQLLKGLDCHPDAVRTLAALYLARGETALARDADRGELWLAATHVAHSALAAVDMLYTAAGASSVYASLLPRAESSPPPPVPFHLRYAFNDGRTYEVEARITEVWEQRDDAYVIVQEHPSTVYAPRSTRTTSASLEVS